MFRFNLFLGSEFDFCIFIFVSKFLIFSKFSISEDLIFWLTSLSNKNSKNNIFSSIFVISKSNASFLGFHEFSKFNMYSRFQQSSPDADRIKSISKKIFLLFRKRPVFSPWSMDGEVTQFENSWENVWFNGF